MVSVLLAILEGVGLGITLAFMTGPAFFALLQTSVRYGFRCGVTFALGVITSDILLVVLAYRGALQLVHDPKNILITGIIGGTILIVFGVFNMFQKHPLDMGVDEQVVSQLSSKITLPLAALKGFAINFFNPFVVLFWLGVVSVEGARYDFSPPHIISLFTSLLITILCTDILKAAMAHKISQWLSNRILLWINRIAGGVLIIAGITLIIRVA